MKLLFENWRRFLNEEMTKNGAVVVFIFNERDQTLLAKRSPNSGWMPNKWSVIGGGIEDGENPVQAAEREVKEETSIIVNKLYPVGKRRQDGGQVYFYACKDWDGQPQINDEHTEWEWVGYDELGEFDVVPTIPADMVWALRRTGRDPQHPDQPTEPESFSVTSQYTVGRIGE